MVFPALAEEGDNAVGELAEARRVEDGLSAVGEEIGILDGQGAELVEECLLNLQLLAERKTWAAVDEYLQAAKASRA